MIKLFKKEKKQQPNYDYLEPYMRFSMRENARIKEYENSITELFIKARNENTIESYRAVMKVQDEFKSFCYADGVEGTDYFYQMWQEQYNKTTNEYNALKDKK